MSLHTPLQNRSLMIKVYFLLVSACPWRLCEFTEIVKDLRTKRALNDLSVYCIISDNVLSLKMNLFSTDGF